MGTAIVIGVGPDQGLGAQLCKRFAAEGLNVLVAGRTKSALDAVVADIAAAGGRAASVVADATREADIVALFDQAGSDLELAIYNAGNNTPGKIIDMEADYFEQSWRVVCFGGFLFGREAVRRMVPKGAGTCCLPARARRSGAAQAMARSIRRRLGFARWRRRWRRNTQVTVSMSATSWSMVRSVVKRSENASPMRPAARSG